MRKVYFSFFLRRVSENARRLKTKIGSVAPAASRAMTASFPPRAFR